MLAFFAIVMTFFTAPKSVDREVDTSNEGYLTKIEAIASVADLDIRQKFEREDFVYLKGITLNGSLDRGSKIIEFDGEMWRIRTDVDVRTRTRLVASKEYMVEAVFDEKGTINLLIVSASVVSSMQGKYVNSVSDSTGILFELCSDDIVERGTVYYKFVEGLPKDYKLVINGDIIDVKFLLVDIDENITAYIGGVVLLAIALAVGASLRKRKTRYKVSYRP